MSQLAQRQPADAITTFNKLGLIATAAAQGSAMSGLIDIALYEGREQDALGLLGDAIAADRVAKDKSSLGRRLAIRASVLISRGDKAGHSAMRASRHARPRGHSLSRGMPSSMSTRRRWNSPPIRQSTRERADCVARSCAARPRSRLTRRHSLLSRCAEVGRFVMGRLSLDARTSRSTRSPKPRPNSIGVSRRGEPPQFF
jgi:hypothetical protein